MDDASKAAKVKVGSKGKVTGALPKAKGPAKHVFRDVKALANLTEPGRYRDDSGKDKVKGLYLQVTNERNRSWILRYFVGKTERQLGLGSYPLFSLSDARKKAKKARLQLSDGQDPILLKQDAKAALAAKVAAPKALSFEQAAVRYWQENKDRWKTEKDQAYALQILKDYAFPKIGKVPVADISVEHVKSVIAPLWNPQSVITADRVRGRIEAVLAYSIVHGYRKDGDNPARWAGLLNKVLPAPRKLRPMEHHPALPWEMIAAFMRELRAVDGVAARALEYLVLTGARSTEVIHAVWDEIDFDNREWRVPSGKMKMARFHIVTLSDAAVELLKTLPAETGNPHIFIGPRRGQSINKMAMADVLKRLHGDPKTSPWKDEDGKLASVHGFRSTLVDWGQDYAKFPSDITNHAIAHVVGSTSDRSYRRGTHVDERRKLMDQWAHFCAGESTVVPFERAKS